MSCAARAVVLCAECANPKHADEDVLSAALVLAKRTREEVEATLSPLRNMRRHVE